MKTLLTMSGMIGLFAASTALAQSVNQIDGPPGGPAVQTAFVYSGSDLIAKCWAKSRPDVNNLRTATVAISAISKAAAAVVTSVGHGFTLLTLPEVTISGATGTGWVSGAHTVNGSFVATVIDADTFSIPVDTTGNGTLAGTVVFSTTAPRKTVAEWAVQRLKYTSSVLQVEMWLGGSSSYGQKCSDAASTTLVSQ